MSDADTCVRWLSLVDPQPSARLQLFCLPYAGGGASTYVPWSRPLRRHSIEVCAVQLPGRENRLRESPYGDLGVLLNALADAIRPRLDRPYAIFGHSMGALLAFELTRLLRDRQAPLPVHLFVSGAQAPDIPRDDEPLHPTTDDGEFLATVAARYGGIPSIVLENAELRSLVLPALRADMTLTESYQYRNAPPVPVDLAAYGGVADRHVDPDRLARWGQQTSGVFASQLFAGDHFFLNDARDDLLANLTARLSPYL